MANVTEKPVEAPIADAGEFFEANLWESDGSRAARDALAGKGLDEKVIRAFGLGWAPVAPDELLNHLSGRGYSAEEITAAGLATQSVRGRLHTQFRSRVIFPVRDRDGRILGFAGLGTHLGPSWPLWVTSPDTSIYRRSEAVFGLDRAAAKIATSKTARVAADCIEVLRAHQDGGKNAVTVHTPGVTRGQALAIADGIPGGIDAVELELAPGMQAELEDATAPEPPPSVASGRRSSPEPRKPDVPHLTLKRTAIVAATALATTILWTGAPLLAVWVGSQVQPGRVLSMWGVVTVLAVLGVLAFLLGSALAWLTAKYDQLTGRPRLAGQTSPWHRTMRGDRVQDIRSRYGVSAPEKAVAACVVAAVLVFEIWFFFFAGSALPSQ